MAKSQQTSSHKGQQRDQDGKFKPSESGYSNKNDSKENRSTSSTSDRGGLDTDRRNSNHNR